MDDAATGADLREPAGARPTLLALIGTRMPRLTVLRRVAPAPAFASQIHGHEAAGLTDRRSSVDSDDGDEKR